jgi:hypothetical protein
MLIGASTFEVCAGFLDLFESKTRFRLKKFIKNEDDEYVHGCLFGPNVFDTIFELKMFKILFYC